MFVFFFFFEKHVCVLLMNDIAISDFLRVTDGVPSVELWSMMEALSWTQLQLSYCTAAKE
jgi:hypothetical protein